MKEKDRPVHVAKIHKVGNSLMILLDKNEREWLNMNEDAELRCQTELGKEGKYVSLWNDGN